MVIKIERCAIPDLIIITSEIHTDSRGYFMETYKKSDFYNAGITTEFLQDNISLSKKGTTRGLHYQLEPKAQGKLLRAISGKIFEVAVDIRKNSPTFGKWVGVTLIPESGKQFWIPPGFAAGMTALEDNSILAYKTTNEYSKQLERGVRWNDPEIGIIWPSDSSGLIISEKDQQHPLLTDAEINFVYGK